MNSMNCMSVRIDILSVALQEMALVLSRDQAAQVAQGFRARVAAVADVEMTEEVDEAACVELLHVLDALGQNLVGASLEHPRI
jgi:hypothetical protein